MLIHLDGSGRYGGRVLRPDYPIMTERLVLRPFAEGDVDALHAYQSRADVCRYIPYEPRTREQIADRIAAARAEVSEPGQAILLAVELGASGRVIGDVMMAWTSREHSSGELGYVFHPDVAGNGYATEAARAMLRVGFETLGLRRIIARVDARNTGSINVLRRLGMRQEAHLVQNEWFKGGWSDEFDFAMLASEWSERK